MDAQKLSCPVMPEFTAAKQSLATVRNWPPLEVQRAD